MLGVASYSLLSRLQVLGGREMPKSFALAGACVSHMELQFLIKKESFGFSIVNKRSMILLFLCIYKLEMMMTSALISSELCKVPLI